MNWPAWEVKGSSGGGDSRFVDWIAVRRVGGWRSWACSIILAEVWCG